MTRRIAAFLTGLAVLLTPARALSEGSVRGAEAQPRLGAAHAGSELVSAYAAATETGSWRFPPKKLATDARPSAEQRPYASLYA